VDVIDVTDQVQEYRQSAPAGYFKTFGCRESDLAEEDYSTTWVGDRSLEIINNWEKGGNFLMTGFIKPHHPFDPPRPWSGKYNPADLSVLPGWLDSCPAKDLEAWKGYFSYEELTIDGLKTVMAAYYACISQIDHHVGRMTALLKKKGLYDNTIIVYTSDHGEYLGFHHLLLKGNFSYDPLARIPLVIKYAGRAAGKSDGLYSNIDIMPSLMRDAGIPVTGEPIFLDSAGRDKIFIENNNMEYVCRTKSRKLIIHRDRGEFFFDLDDDPHELNDVSKDSKYSGDLDVLKKSLEETLISKGPVTTFIDDDAPIIAGDNIIGPGDPRREQMKAFLKNNMTGMDKHLWD